MKGKCKHCGKEVYEIILNGKLRGVEVINNQWIEHSCKVKDVIKE